MTVPLTAHPSFVRHCFPREFVDFFLVNCYQFWCSRFVDMREFLIFPKTVIEEKSFVSFTIVTICCSEFVFESSTNLVRTTQNDDCWSRSLVFEFRVEKKIYSFNIKVYNFSRISQTEVFVLVYGMAWLVLFSLFYSILFHLLLKFVFFADNNHIIIFYKKSRRFFKFTSLSIVL